MYGKLGELFRSSGSNEDCEDYQEEQFTPDEVESALTTDKAEMEVANSGIDDDAEPNWTEMPPEMQRRYFAKEQETKWNNYNVESENDSESFNVKDETKPKELIRMPVNKGTKLTNQNSNIKPTAKSLVIQYNSEDLKKSIMEQKRVLVEHTKRFFSILEDKLLPINFTEEHKKQEVEFIKSFITFVNLLDSDLNSSINEGTIGAISILCQSVFKQRNRINVLEHQLIELNKKINKLEQQMSQTK